MNIFILGRKYEGKSTLAVHIGLAILKARHAYKLLIFDPKWQLRYFPHTHSIREFRYLLHVDKSQGVTFFAGAGFDKGKDDTEEVRKDFSEFCEAVEMESHLRNPPERPLVVILDEVYYLTRGKVHPWLGRMIRLATEGKLYIILAGHRPQDLLPDVRGKGDEFFFFQETDYTELRIVAEIAGNDAAEKVKFLDAHHVLRYVVRSRVTEIWVNPDAWFLPISERRKEEIAA